MPVDWASRPIHYAGPQDGRHAQETNPLSPSEGERVRVRGCVVVWTWSWSMAARLCLLASLR